MAKRRQLRLQHWVACLQAEVEPPAGANNFYNLLRVGYVYRAAEDTEFPWDIPQLDLFARFVDGVGAVDFEIEVEWADDPGRPAAVETYGPWRVTFRSGDPMRDAIFRLSHVPVGGLGWYHIRLLAVTPRRRLLATEYFVVVQ